MRTRQFQENEWPRFFDDFSRRYKGSLVDLEVFCVEIGDQIEGQGLALQGIKAEFIEGEGYRLVVLVGDKANDHIRHSIVGPVQVSLEQTDEGIDAALAIKAADGTTALLRLHEGKLQE